MKRVNVYAVIREMREQIVKTMQERGITELQTVMSYKEWGREQGYKPDDYMDDEDDDTDYTDYKDQDAPYVIFFDKHQNGIDYRVDKVTLKQYETGDPVLEFDCYANELGSDTFGEYDLVFLTLYNVYDTMLDLLEIEDEPEKVWVFTQESNVNGEIHFNVIVCKDRETAVQTMEKEKEWIRKDSWHFRDYDPNDEELTIEESDHSFYINDECDDYYEELFIEEKEIN